ncbi:TetR/AcrR family transcriptional regulator [Nonomuraea longicatena]|uniref:TetR/AcrR family transcriptional regulator n=1 Tax=Nonomuraea longicatena TaxID=83682 RepID=A0ABN1PLH9_9ACTN
MSVGRSARERVRAELTKEITDLARRQLATDGAGGLSLRAVAREMGMVSSAMYRYFPSRDDLLTALIIDGYNAVGEVAERADDGHDPADRLGRWLGLCHAVRDWALAHPHEYALIYGSPVPGYQAPQETLGAAGRAVTVFGRIVADATAAGALRPPPGLPEPPAAVAGDARTLREILPGETDTAVFLAVTAWTGLFGWLTMEVFGQFENVIEERRAAFEHTMRNHAALMGLRG